MKEWMKAEIEELELKCTELGTEVTPYVDDVYTDDQGNRHFSFS